MSDPMDIEPLCRAQTVSGASGYRDSGRTMDQRAGNGRLNGPMCLASNELGRRVRR